MTGPAVAVTEAPRRSLPEGVDRRPAGSRSKKKNGGQKLTRRLHSWFSMVGLLVLLFFGFTGLTLHHQEWTFGIQPETTTITGTLPAGSVNGGAPNYLVISEYLRADQGATGQITDYGLDGETGRISYAGPASSSTINFSTSDLSFEMTSTHHGLVTFANNLHRGENTSTAWSWVIDVTAGMLIAVSVTGLLLQLLIRKRRKTALILLGSGVVIAVTLMCLA